MVDVECCKRGGGCSGPLEATFFRCVIECSRLPVFLTFAELKGDVESMGANYLSSQTGRKRSREVGSGQNRPAEGTCVTVTGSLWVLTMRRC